MHVTIKIALWVLGVTLAILAGTSLYLRSADLSVYEDQIEGILSDAVGHKVDINGLFELRVGELTYLTAEEIQITNAEWSPEPELLSVKHFSVTVDTMSLFSRPIIVENLDIREARLSVESDAAGGMNWDSDQVPPPSNVNTDQAPADLNTIAFRHVDIRDVHLVYDNPNRDAPFAVQLDDLTVEPDDAGILEVDLTGNVNAYPLTAEGKIGPWRNFLTGKNLSANLELSLGRIRLSVDGAAEDLQLLQGVESRFELQGPEIERVIEVFGLPLFATGAFELEADITKHARGRQFHLAGNVGEISLTADGNLDHLADPSLLDVVFDLAGPDTKGVAEVFGIAGAPDVPFQFVGDIQLNRQQLIFNEVRARLGENNARVDGWLQFDSSVPDADITFAANGPNLAVVDPFFDFDGIPERTFDISGHIKKDGQNVDFDNVAATVGDVQIGANGKLDRQGGDDTEVYISVSGPDISVIQTMTGLQDMPTRPFSATAYLRPDPIGINLDDAKLKVGANNLEVDGVIGTIDGLSGTDLSIHGFGPELQSIKLLTGTPYLPLGAYDYQGSISIEGSELSIRSFDATVVGAQASASGSADIGKNLGDFSITLSASSDDVSKLELFDSLKPLTGESMHVGGRISRSNGALGLHQVSADIADLAIDLDGIANPGDGTAVVTLGIDSPNSVLLNAFVPDFNLPDGPVNVRGRVAKNIDDFTFDDLSIELGDLVGAANGTLSSHPMSNDSDLEFRLSGPSLQEFGEIFSLSFMAEKSFSVAGEVNGAPRGFAVENIDAMIGDNEIVGGFTADLRNKPKIKGSISASYLDVAGRLAEMRSTKTEEEPVPDTAASPYLVPDEPLPLEFLNAIDLDIDVKAQRLILSSADVRNFELGLAINDGSLIIEPISFTESQGAIVGHLHLNPADDNYRLDTRLDIENIHFGLLSKPGEDRQILPTLTGNIEIRGAGNTIHEIMAVSNGKLSLRQGAGKLGGGITSRFFGDLFSQILQALNPMAAKETHTNLECAFYDISVVNGLATIDRIAVQTDKVAMAASGSVNFQNEKLKLTLNAKPRKGFGISVGGIANSFFNVGGTLKKPALGINTKGTVTTTGAAIATGGLSLIAKGLWDRASSHESICKPTIK